MQLSRQAAKDLSQAIMNQLFIAKQEGYREMAWRAAGGQNLPAGPRTWNAAATRLGGETEVS
jgi:hypothetical protein